MRQAVFLPRHPAPGPPIGGPFRTQWFAIVCGWSFGFLTPRTHLPGTCMGCSRELVFVLTKDPHVRGIGSGKASRRLVTYAWLRATSTVREFCS